MNRAVLHVSLPPLLLTACQAPPERLPVKPMFVDEAVLQLEMSHRQFLVFLNARSARVNVLYRRRSGDFGLIEPTAN